ncbi:helix-turn-helix domain-containing protein [Leeuwenhoekiella marinoflava]|uniref:Helix-turn-helix protein n=2 Tax=Leeuwenhoekiella marinoflava TaxID=988 RepID=A0A4Q0PMB5_9FLAO|nr:helix-turn-helix domain-containing protein [Leeuwenhoekiella marinoflava]RXG30838.1 helix-turn-helix protein [Leeuwenhoekiella marinoflava]SHF14819.1 transcriptional regulator, AraC family [Leeuwenhoekiella marinoflava DSM 3653]
MTKDIIHIKTISEYHKRNGLAKPQHPLLSVINFNDIIYTPNINLNVTHGFYCIALKHLIDGKMKYGQQEYDFDEGVLAFIAPNQIMRIESVNQQFNHSGWLLIFHPDFLWGTNLAKKIKQYDFFGYDLKEALHLSEKEEDMLTIIFRSINNEYNSNIDKFSQDVIISQLELLLTYSERFYQRQFITRNKFNHSILERFDTLLNDYFKNEDMLSKGLPTVKNLSTSINLSPNYLSKLLKTITGKSTQEFIHEKVIELAKEKLSTTELSVNEIAFGLGFEHPQSFGKLFKKKTELTPLEFRKAFN